MSLSKVKAGNEGVTVETDSRLTEEKRTHERKRNIIILIEKYLLTLGYIDTVTRIEQESNLSLQSWDVADNIDLYMVILEFEQYYEMRFGKLPKMVKKQENVSAYEQLKKAAIARKQVNATINKEGATGQSGAPTPPIPFKPNLNYKKKDDKESEKGDKSEKGEKAESMEIQGNAVNKKKEEPEEFFDVRVVKGMPDFTDVPEYRDLAAYLQRDICIQNPNVRFDDIVGLDDAKRLLKEAVMLPLKYPYLFTGILEPWRGVLLFGPPGTGKTMLAKAVATECKTTFFNISASSVVSKWRGQSEKLIRVLFELARHYQPSTIFLDELDSIMSQRTGSDSNHVFNLAQHEGSRRMKTELLIQMDGLMKNRERVFLLAASNMPWDLDVAMLRRLQKRVYSQVMQILVPLPCLEAREAMLRMYLPEDSTESINYAEAATKCQGYSGSDIKLLCKESAMKPLRRLLYQLENIESKEVEVNSRKRIAIQRDKQDHVKPGPTTREDFEQALKTTKPSPGMNTDKYLKWVENFGSL